MSRTQGEAAGTAVRPRSWLRFRIGYLFIVAAMSLFTLKFGEQAWADHQKQAQVAAAASSVDAQNMLIAKLQRQLRQAHSPGFVLEEARTWGYVRPGEALVSINFKSHKPSQRARRSAAKAPTAPVWQQWWSAFFGR